MPLQGGLYCFAWNAAEAGAEALVSRAKTLGVSALYMAATYHAGWLLRPHAKTGRAFMTPDGAAYFHPAREKYGAIEPQVAPMAQDRDWMRETQAACERNGLEFWAWTIGTHNTPLGLKHPDACVQNAFGDILPHALCPVHPDVRSYLLGLCGDLSENVGVNGVVLESFGYSGWKHGHHHERDLTGLAGVEPQLMGLCFSPSTQSAMEARGVKTAPIRDGVKRILEDAMNFAPDRPDDHPQSMEEAQARVPELKNYLQARREIERDIIREVRKSMKSQTRMWHKFDPTLQTALPPQTTHSTANIYGQNAEKAGETLRAARETLPSEYELHSGMRLGIGLPASEDEFKAIARAASDAGAARLVFYNASESPRRMLEWIPAALAAANVPNTP